MIARAPALRPARKRLRDLALGLASAFTTFGLTAGGCGTNAVGVDACRDIELARCDAAQFCGRVDDVPACRRFYRDHCLHGLAEGVEEPTRDMVDACVKTIQKAGECAKADRGARLDECDPAVSSDPRGAEYACEIVLFPEWATECSFLGKKGDLPSRPHEGGQGGTSSAGGGQGGTP